MKSDQIIRQHLDALAEVDPDVARALSQVGYPRARQRPSGFSALLATIISQQLSTHAADSIQRKLYALMDEVTPRHLIQLSVSEMRAAGLSMRKVEYARGLADAMLEGRFDPQALETMSDDDALAEIIALRGFGRWSAEIHLMFSLQREDIFPADDLALRVALQNLKGLSERLAAGGARDLVEHWSPWRSAGSLLLWHFYRGAPA